MIPCDCSLSLGPRAHPVPCASEEGGSVDQEGSSVWPCYLFQIWGRRRHYLGPLPSASAVLTSALAITCLTFGNPLGTHLAKRLVTGPFRLSQVCQCCQGLCLRIGIKVAPQGPGLLEALEIFISSTQSCGEQEMSSPRCSFEKLFPAGLIGPGGGGTPGRLGSWLPT